MKKVSDTFHPNDRKRLGVKEKIIYFFGGGIFSSIIGFLFYQSYVVAILFAAFPILFYGEYKRRKIYRLKLELNDQFKDALYSISASTSAGRSLEGSLKDAEKNLIRLYGEAAVITTEFCRINTQIKQTNQPPEQALMELGIRSELEDIRNFAEICSICVKTGGNTEKAVGKAVEIITDKINLNREINIIMSQKKLEVKLLTAIPLFILAFLQITSGDYMEVLYRTIEGRVIMSICLFAIVGAFCWGEKISQIDV